MTQKSVLEHILLCTNDKAKLRTLCCEADIETLQKAVEELKECTVVDTVKLAYIRQRIAAKKEKASVTRAANKKQNNEIDKADAIANAVNNSLMFLQKGLQSPVQSNEELLQRIVDFLKVCGETKQLPTVEKLFTAFGYLRSTIEGWYTGNTQGCSWVNKETLKLIEWGKQAIASVDSELVQTGKTKEISWVYRSKNFYGMNDEGQAPATADETQSLDKQELELQAKMLMGSKDKSK